MSDEESISGGCIGTQVTAGEVGREQSINPYMHDCTERWLDGMIQCEVVLDEMGPSSL